MVHSTDHANQIEAWKSIKDRGIDDLFMSFNHDKGNSAYPYQYSRMIGLNFGWLSSLAKDAIKSALQMKLHLAIKNPESDNRYFNVIIETINSGNESQYFSYDHGNELTGPFYQYPDTLSNSSYTPTPPIWSPRMWVGYFINLWLRKGFGINTIFNSIIKPDDRNNPNGYNAICPAVRAHYYLINNERLKHIQYLINHHNLIHLRLIFGIDILELVAGSELFSIIVEMGYCESDPHDVQHDYLNFVGACPPACSGDGNGNH